MDVLVEVFLPLSLAFIMFSLGIGLTLADFRRVAERPRAFLLGALCQIVLLPLVALVIVFVFGLTGEIAAGLMLLSFCPGGVTSNALSRFARGDVALSVSLTALVSLLSILTVPLLVTLTVRQFMGTNAPDVSITGLAFAMVLITTLPVVLGMILRAVAPTLVRRTESSALRISGALFAVIVVGAIAANWDVFTAHAPTLTPSALTLGLVMLAVGIAVTRAGALTWPERKTIAVEAGIQNGTLGITLAPMIVGSTAVLPAMALPSAMYSITMYVAVIPFILWARST